MILIRDILISEELIEEQFLCNLNACKGACCWEGDWGAPLEPEELDTLERIYDVVRAFLSEQGVATIEKKGLYTFFEEPQMYGASLQPNGACVFMVRDERGIAKCGIELAHLSGKTDFKKPISCHLYPVRINKNEARGFEALNYEHWDICSAACELGKRETLPVFRFVREALVRRYGAEFYEELEATAQYIRLQ